MVIPSSFDLELMAKRKEGNEDSRKKKTAGSVILLQYLKLG